MPPRELVPVDTSYREPPTVTVLEAHQQVDLEYAEPSPTMEFLSRIWRRMVFLFKAALVLVVIGTYPALTITAHHIDDSTIEFADGYEWSVGEIGGTVTLVARILEGPGWADDQPKWHPAARLTAMPAWQDGIVRAASDYTRLIAVQTGNEDVAAAARLMTPQDVGTKDRLTAAAEILARYDSSVENGHDKIILGETALAEKLRLTAGWASDARSTLAKASRDTDTWPASFEDIQEFYRAKAKAHVAHELLSAALAQQPEIISKRSLSVDQANALAMWRRAAMQKPLFVTNQSGSDAILGNHLTNMAFLMDEAGTASAALAEAIEQPIQKASPARSAELSATAPPSP